MINIALKRIYFLPDLNCCGYCNKNIREILTTYLY